MVDFINPFQPIDLLDVAKEQHGPDAALWETPTHAYGWSARKPGDATRHSLNLHTYVDEKFGGDCRVVQSDFEATGWQRFYPYDPAHDWTVLPVILVAADHLWEPAAIKAAAGNFRHNVAAMADWYADQLGRTMRLLEPQLFASWRATADWYRIYRDETDRNDLWKACQAKILVAYGSRINPNIIYLVTQFCGDTPEWDYDAAGGIQNTGIGWLAVVSSFACSHRYDPGTVGNRWDETIIYAEAHEVGHCLGLPHTSQDQPNYEQSIMQWGRPPSAILTPTERERLLANPFLSMLA